MIVKANARTIVFFTDLAITFWFFVFERHRHAFTQPIVSTVRLKQTLTSTPDTVNEKQKGNSRERRKNNNLPIHNVNPSK